MVVLLDFEDDALPAYFAPHTSAPNFNILEVKPLLHTLLAASNDREDGGNTADSRPNPNINGFSAALSCYP